LYWKKARYSGDGDFVLCGSDDGTTVRPLFSALILLHLLVIQFLIVRE
jgi:hypothetical protein